MQREEAASRQRELEQALAELTLIEKERAEAWREAAHDLRGSVSVISSAAAVLNREGVPDPARSQFSHMLRKGVVSLHDLLTDLMNLARLEAGHDQRTVVAFDAAVLMREFCDAMVPAGVQLCLGQYHSGREADALLSQLPLGYVRLASRYSQKLDDPAVRDEMRQAIERAHRLGLCVIGQQVEDPQAAATLWMSGVDFIQGNLVQQAAGGLDYDFDHSVL
jgi:hypothetical protein